MRGPRRIRGVLAGMGGDYGDWRSKLQFAVSPLAASTDGVGPPSADGVAGIRCRGLVESLIYSVCTVQGSLGDLSRCFCASCGGPLRGIANAPNFNSSQFDNIMGKVCKLALCFEFERES